MLKPIFGAATQLFTILDPVWSCEGEHWIDDRAFKQPPNRGQPGPDPFGRFGVQKEDIAS